MVWLIHKPYQIPRQPPNAKNMGLLDGGAASIFNSLMGAYFLPATLHQAGALVYTDGVITSNGAVDVDCKVQIDVASYRMQQSANYIDGDVRLLILASAVTTDDELTVSSQRYKIYATSRDPAGAYWDCAGRVA